MSLNKLFARYAATLPSAEIVWIGVRPERKTAMQSRDVVNAIEHLGLEGDHRCLKTPGSARQVTLISVEFVNQIAIHLGKENIPYELLRRNLVVKGINLNALRYQRFQLGEAILEATALCHPCQRMETALGYGGVAAMLGYGGLCCKILKSGEIKVGDMLNVELKQPSLF